MRHQPHNYFEEEIQDLNLRENAVAAENSDFVICMNDSVNVLTSVESST